MVSPPKVLVHEFITGGGHPDPLPRALAGEGAAMLSAVLADFQAWGGARTLTMLDPRLSQVLPGFQPSNIPADEVVCVPPGEYAPTFSALLRCCTAALIIAPETGGVLARLSAAVCSAGVRLLGSRPEAVAASGSKAVCCQRFAQAGLPQPFTRRAAFSKASAAAAEVGFPLVIKPLDGVGCEGVHRVDSAEELASSLAVLRQITCHEEILLQRLVAGVHASVSLLAAQGRSVPLSLNGQQIIPGRPFVYQGGIVPLGHPAQEAAFQAAQAAVRLIPGLSGYVGVDLILAGDQPVLIEINPRITTSYAGLRQVYPGNLAQAIWDACESGALPAPAALTGAAVFAKNDPQLWQRPKHTAARRNPEVD